MLHKILFGKRTAPDWKQLMSEIKEAKKDPRFRKELKEFIRVTTN